MSINYALDIGDLIKVLVYVGAGLWFIRGMQGRIDMLAKEIKSLQETTGKIAQVLIDLARQDERLNAIDRRVEDLRRGRGFIQRAVDGEYPQN